MFAQEHEGGDVGLIPKLLARGIAANLVWVLLAEGYEQRTCVGVPDRETSFNH